jgi:hypothetical protein
MPWQTVQRQSHEFGSASTYLYGQGNVVILDSYEDQYSLNWSTDLQVSDFTRLWVLTGGKDNGAIIHTGAAGLQELRPGELLDVLRSRPDLLRQPVSLFRVFFSSVSVTWQLLPLVDMMLPSVVVGVASNRLDPSSISRYFQATARPALRQDVADLPAILENVHVESGDLSPLMRAATVALRYGEL